MKSTVIFVVVFYYLSATEVASQISLDQLTTSDQAISSVGSQLILSTNSTSRKTLKETCLKSSAKESRGEYLIASNVILATASRGKGKDVTPCTNDHNIDLDQLDLYFEHPNYNSQTLENDISLMRLTTGFSSEFKHLPTPLMRFINYERRILTVVGWNSTNTSNNSLINQIKIGESLSKCSFGNYTNFICVSNDFNNGIVSKNGHALYDGRQLVGIRSHSRGNYDVYTRVDRYLDWILSFIQMASTNSTNSTNTV